MISTVKKLDVQGRRLDRINSRTSRVLELMRRRGVTLHFDQSGARVRWWLSTGAEVDARIAAVLIARGEVVSVGDALFAGAPSQTYRYVEELAD
jgi:hypothetical protein